MDSRAFSRRSFLKRTGIGAAACATGVEGSALAAAIDNTEPMKITRIDAVTFRKEIHVGGGSGGSDNAEFMWVRLHTDRGIVGTGETYPFNYGQIGALQGLFAAVARTRRARHRRHLAGVL